MSGIKLFAGVSTEGAEKVTDSVGGFVPIESNVYMGTLTAAYVSSSADEDNHGQALNIVVQLEDGKEHREILYVLDKEGSALRTNKQGKTVKRDAFVIADDISLLASETPFVDALFEEKLVEVWDNDAGKRVPKPMPALVDAIGRDFKFALQTTKKFKQELVNGTWTDTAKIIHETKIVKVMDTDGFTVLEKIEGADNAVFEANWVKAHGGKVRDFTQGKTPAAPKTGIPGQAPAASTGARPVFKRKD